jgi:hypothetical protein
MKKVSLKLSKLTIPAKIEKGRHIVTSMTGNPSFLTPLPTLLSILTALTNLENADTLALGGGKLLKATMRDKEAIVDTLLTQLGHYVEAIASGSETIILSAGMEPSLSGGRKARVFGLTNGTLPGEINLVTKFLRGSSYIWQMVADPFPSESAPVDPTHIWEQIGVSTKSSFMISDLMIGKKYWFRVANVSKEGQGAWSDPLSKVVI